MNNSFVWCWSRYQYNAVKQLSHCTDSHAWCLNFINCCSTKQISANDITSPNESLGIIAEWQRFKSTDHWPIGWRLLDYKPITALVNHVIARENVNKLSLAASHQCSLNIASSLIFQNVKQTYAYELENSLPYLWWQKRMSHWSRWWRTVQSGHISSQSPLPFYLQLMGNFQLFLRRLPHMCVHSSMCLHINGTITKADFAKTGNQRKTAVWLHLSQLSSRW